jgi:hypothetical protein
MQPCGRINYGARKICRKIEVDYPEHAWENAKPPRYAHEFRFRRLLKKAQESNGQHWLNVDREFKFL